MATKDQLSVGQCLDVSETPRRDAEPITGLVTKVGRLLVDIETRPGVAWSKVTFRIDSQRENGDWSSWRFWLPGEYEGHLARLALIRSLREARVEFPRAAEFTTDQLRRILDVATEKKD